MFADVNECTSVPCKNNGLCVNRKGGFNCVCQNGYKGQTCENGKQKDNQSENKVYRYKSTYTMQLILISKETMPLFPKSTLSLYE